MIKSNFEYIFENYPQLANIGQLAERNVYKYPSDSLSKLRILSANITNLQGTTLELGFEKLPKVNENSIDVKICGKSIFSQY